MLRRTPPLLLFAVCHQSLANKYKTGYFKSVTPGDALDVTSRMRSDVFSEATVVTRTIDVWGRTGGVSVIVPYVALKAISPGSHLSNDGLSDISFMLQTNLFGGPALTREQFRYFVPE